MNTMCRRCREYYEKYPLQSVEAGGTLEHVIETARGGYFRVTSSPLECAFKVGRFQNTNWNCQTMNELRSLCEYHPLDKPPRTNGFDTFFARHDDAQASLGVVMIPEGRGCDEVTDGYLVMSWYKSRGKTGRAMVMCDNEEPCVLTLEIAEWIIDNWPYAKEAG